MSADGKAEAAFSLAVFARGPIEGSASARHHLRSRTSSERGHGDTSDLSSNSWLFGANLVCGFYALGISVNFGRQDCIERLNTFNAPAFAARRTPE
jgi:hypothetical protein